MSSLPKFYACHKKIKAREETIANIYRQYFGDKTPLNSQYWTMCASQVNEQGEFQKGSEMGQMLSYGLIQPNQFYGVDINEEVIKRNQKHISNANWFCNDFITQMKRQDTKDQFNPCIVNADLLNMRKKAALKAGVILSFLTDVSSNNILLVCNFMLNNSHNCRNPTKEEIEKEFDQFIPTLKKTNSFQYAWQSKKWQMHSEGYIYNGSGSKSNTYLASFLFIKSEVSK
jgi:hypothetical protein